MSAFSDQGVEFLIVGAHALAAHGHVRATKDLNIWVRPEAANARRVLAALRALGAALQGLTEDDLTSPGLIYQVQAAETARTVVLYRDEQEVLRVPIQLDPTQHTLIRP